VNQPVAIEILLPDSGRVEVTDTFRPSGRALNALGDSVQAPLLWVSFDSTLRVLDSTTGVSLAAFTGSARLQAHTTGKLFSNPQTVSILARLDSILAGGPTRDTVFVTPVPPDTAADSLSDSLAVQAYAFDGATAGVAASRVVTFSATVFPQTGPVVTLVPGTDTVVTVLTSFSGVAATQVRLHKGPVPDSVLVTATMKHLDGTAVHGSPLTFVVEFRP
jgi:hypothetical protein